MRKNVPIIIVYLLSILPCTVSAYPRGQHFILTLPETFNPTTLASWLAKTRPAGVMLLAYHCTDRQKTKHLTAMLQREAKKLNIPPLFITIDWEGGIVSRPNEEGGFHSVPSPWALAQAGRTACFLGGMLIGQQARSVGINVCFAPSLDLFDPNNHILGTRCFSDNPATVTDGAIAFAHGLMSQGVVPVIKHFPGLGLGSGDTHHVAVGIQADNDTFAHHSKPFIDALSAGMPIVMATHAAFPQFGNIPATLSPRAIEMLQEKAHGALCITDDFCMKAVTVHDTRTSAAMKSLEAGYNAIIFSGKPAEQIELIDNLQKRSEHMTHAQRSKLEQQQHAINACKKKYFPHTSQYFPACNEKEVASFLAHRCLQQQRIYTVGPLKRVTLITVDIARIRPPERWFSEHGKSYLTTQLTARGIKVHESILDAKTGESCQELKKIVAAYDPDVDGPLIIQSFFYANDSWNMNQKKWFELLTPLQKNIIVISLGHPYEKHLLPKAQIINVGSFHKPLLNVVAEKLCTAPVRTGATELLAQCADYLKGKRFGLLCHRCSVIRYHDHDAFLPDALLNWARQQDDTTELAALFCPEHGLLGDAEAAAHVASHHQSKWNCPIYSLHGTVKKPTPAMLKGLDVLIIDLQEVGTRCFTYISTTKLALEAAVQEGVEVMVLDRPNPLMMWGSCGPEMEKKYESFLGAFKTPFLHGSTIGALATKMNETIGARLTVLNCQHINKTSMSLDVSAIAWATAEPFIPPSPNLCSIDHVFAYPCTVFLEGTNYSEGRGTHYPFLQFGAPWVDGQQLADALNKKKLPGLYFEPITFTPQRIPGMAENPKHNNALCNGIFLHMFDHPAVQPIVTAHTIIVTLFKLYPEQSKWITYGNRFTLDLLVGNDSWRRSFQKARS